MGKTSLENAIRDEAEQTIRGIALKEAEEIKRLNEEYAAEINEFKSRILAQTEARMRQESSKLENRANLELKKLKLKSLEKFINDLVEEAIKSIRDDLDYKKFLLDAIADALGRIPAGAEIRLRREDLSFQEEIRKAAKAAHDAGDIEIVEDNTIKWGGCIIVDVSGGRIFDNTIERIWFRKSALIRREVMSLMGPPHMDTGKDSSCKIR